jgi:hypothetical protein
MSTHAYDINLEIIDNPEIDQMSVNFCGDTLAIEYGREDSRTETYISLDEIRLLRNFFAHVYECEKEADEENDYRKR